MQHPDVAHTDLAETDDVRDLLAMLVRPGAKLRRLTGATSAVANASTTAHGREREISETTITRARAAGFLRRDPSGSEGEDIVTERGRVAYRKHLMSRPAQTGDRRRTDLNAKRTGPHTGTTAASTAERPAERRSVIEQLALRKDAQGKPLLDPIELAAGLRLAQDFEIAGLQPRVTARWSAEPVNKPRRRAAPDAHMELSEVASAARDRLRRALSDLGGELADVAFAACCFEETLQTIAGARYWSTASARLALSLSLKRLAQHYGMIGAHSPTGMIRRWADADFKPTAKPSL